MLSQKKSLWLISSVVLILLVLLLVIFQPKPTITPPPLATVPLPVLEGERITLRVAHVVNPRFPALSIEQQQSVLRKAAALVQQNFNLDIYFEAIVQLDIAAFFALRNPDIESQLKTTIVDPNALSATDLQEMRSGIERILQGYQNEKAQVLAFARPYLTTAYRGEDFSEFSEALVKTLLTRLQFWHEETAEDGKPVLDGTPYNEWVWWDSIGYGQLPYEVVITNQLVASAETYAMDVHSCLRGGISGGTTSYSKLARYKTYSYVTAFPVLNDNAVLTELRGDAHYNETEKTDYVAAVLAHELGHMLLHLGHPFGSESCIMSPTPLLQFRSWYQRLEPADCALSSQPQMTPGVASIEYHPEM